MCKIAFLDRDGVINKENTYVHDKTQFEFLPGSIEALALLKKHDYLIHIITNQAGIGKGYFSERSYHDLTDWYLGELKDVGINVDDVSFCPHHAQASVPRYRVECRNRKPNPGMIEDVIARYGSIDMINSFLVGDKISDVEAGLKAGLKKLFLVKSGHIIDLYQSNSFFDIQDDLLSVVKLLVDE